MATSGGVPGGAEGGGEAAANTREVRARARLGGFGAAGATECLPEGRLPVQPARPLAPAAPSLGGLRGARHGAQRRVCGQGSGCTLPPPPAALAAPAARRPPATAPRARRQAGARRRRPDRAARGAVLPLAPCARALTCRAAAACVCVCVCVCARSRADRGPRPRAGAVGVQARSLLPRERHVLPRHCGQCMCVYHVL